MAVNISDDNGSTQAHNHEPHTPWKSGKRRWLSYLWRDFQSLPLG